MILLCSCNWDTQWHLICQSFVSDYVSLMSEFFILNIILFGCIQSMHIYNLSHLLTYILCYEYFNDFFFQRIVSPKKSKFSHCWVLCLFWSWVWPPENSFKIYFHFLYIFIFILKSQDAKYAKSLNFNIFFSSWLISTVYCLLLSWICLQLYLWVSCVESLTSITEVSVSRTTWCCFLLG